MDNIKSLEQAAIDFGKNIILFKMIIDYGIRKGIIIVNDDPKN